MARSFAAKMRRATRLMRPRKLTKSASSMQKAMTSLVVRSTLAPLTALKPKTAKPRKTKAPKAGQTLGPVLTQLRAMQSMLPGTVDRSAGREIKPRIPNEAQYLDRTHRSAAGSRNYKLYLPASQPKRPKGLILMLHGCTQTPDDFATGTHMNAQAEKHGLAVAYPAQVSRHNAASCWNWFKPRHQSRSAGEPAILASMTRKLMREFGLKRESVYVAGLSAGGAMATILADVYPDVYSAAGVHSGLARGSARDLISAMSVMRSGATAKGLMPAAAVRSRPVRRIIFQGTTDSTVHPANAAMIVAAAVGRDAVPTKMGNRAVAGRAYARSHYAGPDGDVLIELWMIEGAGHAWSGGRAAGTYTDRKGPDASAQMVRFFLAKSALDQIGAERTCPANAPPK